MLCNVYNGTSMFFCAKIRIRKFKIYCWVLKMWFSLWVVICIPLTCIASSSTVTYVDTLIDTFLSKEQLIWDKIDKHLNPLPDIQLIDSHHDTYTYLYEVHNDFKRLISINSIINVFWMKIEAFSWREAKVNTTLTMEEIDEKYNEVLKLSDSFNHTSLADFWDYCVAKMVRKLPTIKS